PGHPGMHPQARAPAMLKAPRRSASLPRTRRSTAAEGPEPQLVTMGDAPLLAALAWRSDCVQHAGIATRLGLARMGGHGDPMDAGRRGATRLQARGRRPTEPRHPALRSISLFDSRTRRKSAIRGLHPLAQKNHSKSQRRPVSGDTQRRQAALDLLEQGLGSYGATPISP